MKRTWWKSLISMILCAVMVLQMVPLAAYAVTPDWTENGNQSFVQNGETNQWTEIQRNTAAAMRDPAYFHSVEGLDILGAEVGHDEYSRTYLLEDGTYLTRVVDDPIMYRNWLGKMVDIDNTIVAKKDYYTNAANSYQLKLPKNGGSITVENDGHQLVLKPLFASYGTPVVSQNAARYNQAADGVDLQYMAFGSYVKEDIILNRPVQKMDFSYELLCDDLDFQLIDNVLYATRKNTTDAVFVISAPYMEDNSGMVSFAITMQLTEHDGKQILTVVPDWEWIHDPLRAYPIVIDPTIELSAGNLEWCLVENGVGISGYPAGPNVQHRSNPYLYAGFERGNLTGIQGLTYGQTRSYIKINYDFSTIPEGTIISAKLKAYKYAGYPGAGTKVYCKLVTNDWSNSRRCWNTQPTEHSIIADPVDVSGGKKWVEWDIATAVIEWKNGRPNYGLVLAPEYEEQAAVCFSGPGNQHGKEAMYFDISWTVPNAVDENMPLDAPVINLRPLTQTHSSGVQSLNGVFADGVVRPTLRVDYRLNQVDSGIYESADYGRIYPDSTLFAGQVEYTLGYVDLFQSNWQSKLFQNFENNLLYNVYATGTNGSESTPEGISDSFIVYQFTEQDTLPYIADFYGVSLSQILADNRPQDYLGFAGNTYFIRNPQKNANVPYSRPDNLTDDHKRDLIYANLGRGMHSEFDLEPVNVNIGNYYFGSTDAVSKEYSGTFAFERSYNSIGTKSAGVFGRGWSFEYAQTLSGRADGSLVYTMGDGRQLVFAKTETGYVCPVGYYMTLEKHLGDGPENTTYTITKTDGTVYLFNCYGLLVSITDRNGFATTIQYDDNYRICGIVTNSGRQYVISTNENGQIVSVRLPNGGTLSYVYENGNLVRYINADGDEVRYVYNENGQMTEWYDGNGNRVVKNEYDSQGRIIRQTDALNKVSTLTYTDGETVVKDPDGGENEYHYDESYRTTEVSGTPEDKTASYNEENQLESVTELGITQRYEYDENGNITKQILSDGTSREMTYDAYGNILTIKEFDGGITVNEYDEKGQLKSRQNPDGSVIRYTYDDYGQTTSITDGNGGVTKFEYDGLDKMTMTDADGKKSYCYYDAMGNLISEIDANGMEVRTIYSKQGKKLGVWKTGDIHEQYVYDGNGNCIQVIDPEGFATVMTYDAANRMLTATNPANGVIKYAYDENGNLISETDPLGHTTTYAYDAFGRKKEMKNALGHTTSYSYNKDGRMEKVTAPDGSVTAYTYDAVTGMTTQIEDRTGVTSYTYDIMARLIKTVYPDGSVSEATYDLMGRTATETAANGLVTSYTYDANGNLLTAVDSAGGSVKYTYDKMNRLLTSEDSLGRITTRVYDDGGRLIEEITADGSTTKRVYDAAGNLEKLIDANNVETVMTYDKRGLMLTHKDGNGSLTQYRYDELGNKIAEIDALNGVVTYTYDAAQNLLCKTNQVNASFFYEYDALGQVVKTTDEDGYVTLIEYDKMGNAVKTTAPDGSVNRSYYGKNGYLEKVESADGLVTQYENDQMGRVTREWDNAGNVRVNAYNQAGQLIRVTDALERTSEYKYDLHGNQTEFRDFNGDVYTYEYDTESRLIAETGPDGRRTEYGYDLRDNRTSMKDAEGNVWEYTYDKLSRKISEKNPLGQVTSYGYDNVSNQILQIDAAGGENRWVYSAVNAVLESTDANGNTTAYEYDAAGKVIRQTSPEGGVTEYAYDGRGNVTHVKDPLGFVTEHVFDGMGNEVKTVSPRGAERTYVYNHAGLKVKETDPLGAVTTFVYTRDGKMKEKTLPNGLVFAYAYDAIGQVLSVSDSTGRCTEMVYNQFGDVATETRQDGAVTAYEYDSMHRMTKLIAPNGAVTGYEYDVRGNLIRTLGPTGNLTIYSYDILDRVQILEQSLMAPVSYVYDELGQVIEVKQGEKHTVTTYDNVGNTLAVQNPLGDVMRYGYDRDNRMITAVTYGGHASKTGYDAAGNVTSVIDALGSERRFGYNSDGALTNQFDALGHETQYRYDLAGNLIGVKDPLEHITSYGYDIMGNMTSMLTPDGNETTYSYDLHDNMISITSPGGEVEQFIYDVESRLEKSIRPDGSSIVYDYDEMDKLLSKTYSDDTQQVLYAYDLAGNRISMNDATGAYAYTYDVLGRLETVTDGAGRVVVYHYDEYGRTAQIDYPEGRSVSYGYDLNDNLLTVTDSNGQSVSYTYDKDGNPLTCERSNGVDTSYTYDAAGNVLSVINECNGEVLSSFAYTYDPNGQILTEDAVQGADISRKEFVYDEAGQLDGYTEELNGQISTTSYFYNPDGSRVSVTTGADEEAVVAEYDDNGRLTKQTTAEGTTEFIYDANGNLVEKRGAEQVISYAYDIENRLEAVREGGALLMAATYDGDGNRVFQVNRQETTVILEKSDYGTDPILPVGQSGAANGSSVEKGNNGGVPVDDSENRIPGVSQEELAPLPSTDGAQQPDVHTYYEKVYVDPADSIFWYGFGQGFLQFLANLNSSLAAYLSDWFCHLWDFVTGQYELVLHSEAVYSEEDLELLDQLGLEEDTLTELESGMVTVAGGNDAIRGSNTGARPKPDAGSTQSAGLQAPGNIINIPQTPDQVTRIDYDLSYYVNDINTPNVQVLMTYGRNSEEKAVYTYGLQRIAEDDLQTATYSDYLCDGRGSVSQTVVAGTVELSLRYDAYGVITSEVDVNFVGFAFNGEESNTLTGLQYLRARYYDTELGSFLTADSYLGSASNPLSRNRYTYAENDPVNNFDPSGHYSTGNRGIEKYNTGNSLNELRDFMTAAGLYAGEVNARNSFNGSIARANGTEMSNYASISGISQATANYYINQGIAKAGEASMNYGCTVPTVPNEAVAKLQYNVNASRNSANAQIQQIKTNKKTQYDAYLEALARLKAENEQKRLEAELVIRDELKNFDSDSFKNMTDAEKANFLDRMARSLVYLMPKYEIGKEMDSVYIGDIRAYFEVAYNINLGKAPIEVEYEVNEKHRAEFASYSLFADTDIFDGKLTFEGDSWSYEVSASAGEDIESEVVLKVSPTAFTAEFSVSSEYKDAAGITTTIGLEKPIYPPYTGGGEGERVYAYDEEYQTDRATDTLKDAVITSAIITTTAFVIWEGTKWGVAALLAPYTGGGSLAVAGAMP